MQDCRHRLTKRASGAWTCASPRLIVRLGGVSKADCERCFCADHEFATEDQLRFDQAGRDLRVVLVANTVDSEPPAWPSVLGSVNVELVPSGTGDESFVRSVLDYIIESWNRLPEFAIFAPADPFLQTPSLYRQLVNWDSLAGFNWLGECCHAFHRRDSSANEQPAFDEVIASLELPREPNYLSAMTGNCFAVRRARIRQRPIDFYERLRHLSQSDKHARAISKLWGIIFSQQLKPSNDVKPANTECPPSEGLVTVAGKQYFRELQFLLRSLDRASRHPLVIYDLGLEPAQRRWVSEHKNVHFLAVPPFNPIISRLLEHPYWALWLTAVFIFHAPFQRVIWLDSDCIAMKDLSYAFAALDDGPLITRDATTGKVTNDPHLFDELPVSTSVEEAATLNAGVVGLCKERDAELLAAWLYGVQWAAANPNKQDLISFHDQGLLLWSLHATGQTGCIRRDLTWNRPGGILREGETLSELRQRNPRNGILHWLGNYKLSMQLSEAEAHERGFLDLADQVE